MTPTIPNDLNLSYEALKRRMESAESALQAIRSGQVDRIMGDRQALIIRLEDAHARAAHIKRVLLAIRNVNQLIVSENDPLRLIERACSNLTETMGYHNAWIALLDQEGKVATATASSGFNGGFEALGTPLKRGVFPACMMRSLAQGEIAVVWNPAMECADCPLSALYEDYAGFSRRLLHEGRTYGVLSVSVPKAYANDAEEQSLFDEVAGDLAFALHKIEMAARLDESQRRCREIYEGSRDGFVMTDPAGRIIDANPAYCSMLGYSLDELRALPDFFAITPQRWHAWEANEIVKKRLLDQGFSGLYEKEYVRKDGSVFPVEMQCFAVRGQDGEIAALWGTVRDITERKQAEEALKSETERLEFIIQGSRLGAWVWNVQTNVAVFNAIWAEMLGYALEELAPCDLETWKSLVHPCDLEIALERLVRCVEGRTPDYECEFRMRHKNGHWVWILDQGCVMRRDSEGRPLLMFGTHMDITKRKLQEERIALLGHMLDSAPASITIHGVDGRFVFVNRITVALHGYSSQEEFLAVNLRDLDVPESAALLAERFRQIAVTGEARFEAAHFRKDGSILPLEVLAKAIEWEGRPVILSIATDITERKAVEKALRESEERYRTLANSGQALIWTSGLDGKCDYFNQPWLDFTGRSLEQEMGNGWTEGVHPEDFDHCVQTYVAAFEKREPFSMEYRLRHASGEYRWLQDDGKPRFDTGGNFLGFIGHCLDITKREQAEAERIQLEGQLAQAQKMESVGRLAGGVAHDYNNMLNVIIGYSELALDQMTPADPLYADLREILAAGLRSSEVTRQLLAFARKQTISPKILDLNHAVEGMLKMLRRLIGEDIEMVWLPGAGLWPVNMDPSQLDQILANLCVNARDAIAGVGQVIIETQNAAVDETMSAKFPDCRPGNYVVLAVSDDGCGMDATLLENIFEPFFTTKSVEQGTGLGLSTIYGIVKQNQGFISVDSKPGMGTAFRIYLPKHEAPAASTPVRAREKIPQGKGETVLVVEDETAIIQLVLTMLEKMGYQVLTASNPREAQDLAKGFGAPIHLLISDVIMPDMNGKELADSLKPLFPDLKVLFMSGYTANVIAHHGVLDANVHFLEKPFSRQKLALSVREALGD